MHVLLICFNQLNHCYWEQNVCLRIKICKYCVSNQANIEVVVCSSKPQLYVSEILNKKTWLEKG